MEKKEFPKAQVFTFVDSVDYAAGSIVSKILLRNEKGTLPYLLLIKASF